MFEKWFFKKSELLFNVGTKIQIRNILLNFEHGDKHKKEERSWRKGKERKERKTVEKQKKREN